MDKYSRHELLDRTSTLVYMLENLIICHPAINKKYKKQAAKAHSILYKLYQDIGAKHFN